MLPFAASIVTLERTVVPIISIDLETTFVETSQLPILAPATPILPQTFPITDNSLAVKASFALVTETRFLKNSPIPVAANA